MSGSSSPNNLFFFFMMTSYINIDREKNMIIVIIKDSSMCLCMSKYQSDTYTWKIVHNSPQVKQSYACLYRYERYAMCVCVSIME